VLHRSAASAAKRVLIFFIAKFFCENMLSTPDSISEKEKHSGSLKYFSFSGIPLLFLEKS
jgi:hypothetical protein